LQILKLYPMQLMLSFTIAYFGIFSTATIYWSVELHQRTWDEWGKISWSSF